MIGAQLKPALRDKIGDVVAHAREQGLLVLQAADGVVRLLPPLIVTEQETNDAMARLQLAIEEVIAASN